MWLYMLALLLTGQLLGAGYSYADPASRLEALLGRHDLSARRFERVGPIGVPQALPLKDTGEGGETLYCLTFDKRDTKRVLRVPKGHAYVCFNFLQNPSEAVGNVLNGRGRQRCLITGFFSQGATMADDCLVLAFCGNVYVTGSCSW